MKNSKSWTEFLSGAYISSVMLAVGGTSVGVAFPGAWHFLWLWALASLVLLVPVFPNPGWKMCFAILQSMNGRRAFGTVALFGVTCVILYFAFTKVVAIALAGLFLIIGLLASLAFLVRRTEPRPENEKMEFAGSMLAVTLYLTLVALAFCNVFITAVQNGKAAAWQAPPFVQPFELKSRPVNGLQDVRGEIHVHSKLSHDSRGMLAEIAAAAKKNGIRWIILTDHISALPEGEHPKELDGVLFVYGNERNWKKQGSHFRMPLDSLSQLHLYGHTELLKEWDGERWDAIELVNYHANALENKWAIVGKMFSQPGKIYGDLDVLLPKNLARWQELAEKEQRPIPIFGGPDAHQNVNVLGVQADPYDLIFHRLSTHVWLEEGQAVTERLVLEAIKKGRTYIAFESLGDPTGFQFWSENEQYWFFTGEEVRAPARLIVKPPPTNDCAVRVYRDNMLIMERGPGKAAFCDLTIPNPTAGFWRTEIWRNGRIWVISGQILVK